MIICGVDPGTVHCGYCVVDGSAPRGPAVQVMGVAEGGASKVPLEERLFRIHGVMASIFLQYRPEEVVIEDVHVGRNARTAIALGEARGIILLCAARLQLRVTTIKPSEAKKGVIGNGSASKYEVQRAVKLILGLRETPPLDASDAAALAITRAWSRPIEDILAMADRR